MKNEDSFNELSKSPQLLNFWNEINHNVKHNSLDEQFNSITNTLMNYLCLSVSNATFKITECEIYYYDIEHPDPYVHQGESQLYAGKLYFNKAGGVDITFGNIAYPLYASVLIRGIRNLKTNEYTNKITEIVNVLFENLGNIITEDSSIHLRELLPEYIKIEVPIRSKRIGLKKKEADFEEYIDKPYRYITELTPTHNFKDKENVVKQLLAENKIQKEDIIKILGYNLSV